MNWFNTNSYRATVQAWGREFEVCTDWCMRYWETMVFPVVDGERDCGTEVYVYQCETEDLAAANFDYVVANIDAVVAAWLLKTALEKVQE